MGAAGRGLPGGVDCRARSVIGKALGVRTTIDAKVGRRGGAYSVEELENVLNRARKLLADTSALLELEIDRLFKTELDENEGVRLKEITDLIRSTQKAMAMVMEIEVKYGLSSFEARSELDLEAAREEILERFRRIRRQTARGKAA